MASDTDSVKGLEALVVENRELEQLEALLSQFNLFEAIGAVRRELRHSDMLAFLLRPTEAHGFGDHFLRRLLQRALARATSSPTAITPVMLDVSELHEASVRRESNNIDILIIDERNRLAVILENKIDAAEHSEQLRRYWDRVGADYPGFKLIGLYLTPDGDEPSDGRYLAIDYTLIANLVDEVISTRSSTLGPDVRVLLSHYSQLLRRHIVSDSEIADLCRRIYRKHSRALDLIFEHRPDPQQHLRELLEQLIAGTSGLVLDDCNKRYIRFAPAQWDVTTLKAGTGWTKSGRMLLFEFQNNPGRLVLKLYIGPGPARTRELLHGVAAAHPHLFPKMAKALSSSWTQLYTREFLAPNAFEDEDAGTFAKAARSLWEAFVKSDLPAIRDLVAAQDWLEPHGPA
ncbi:MAG: PD-(D/E)XK nuclease family protein [Myxococcales bacterium]|nr:PD-(D/E)XK nuclease family protein [Myxococcales bacterium]